MNLSGMIKTHKESGNHGLVAELFEIFSRDLKLREWRKYFESKGGFSQDPWYAMWDILIQELKINNFLDLGVHAGQFSILSQLLAKRHNKKFTTYSVSPFDGTGDKYSTYTKTNYLDIYMDGVRHFKLNDSKFIRLRGLSQEPKILAYFKQHEPKFELMYIDGSHDYAVVMEDVREYVYKWLAPGGIVIFDDANFFVPANAPESHKQGYQEVVLAVDNTMEGNPEFEFLFNLTHNRIFRKR